MRHRGPSIKNIEIDVNVQPCILDKTVRFYEAEANTKNLVIRLPMGPPLAQTVNPQPGEPHEQRLVYCTDRNIICGWRDQMSHDLQLTVTVPEAPSARVFYVLVFSGRNLSKLAAVVRVEIHGLRCESINGTVGQANTRMVNIPSSILGGSRALMLHTSNMNLIQVPTDMIDVTGDTKFPMTVGKNIFGNITLFRMNHDIILIL